MYVIQSEVIFFSGVILNDFIQAASDIESGKPVKKRLRLYSAHDFNIGSLMEVTKVIRHEQSIPEYGSLFALELYKSRGTGELTVVVCFFLFFVFFYHFLWRPAVSSLC